MTASSILPQFFTAWCIFMGISEHTRNKTLERLWQLRTQMTCLGAAICTKLQNAVTPNFAPETNMAVLAFSVGICLGKCLTHYHNHAREWFFKRTTYGKPYFTVQWSRDRWLHMIPEGQGLIPISLSLNISTTVRDRWFIIIEH